MRLYEITDTDTDIKTGQEIWGDLSFQKHYDRAAITHKQSRKYDKQTISDIKDYVFNDKPPRGQIAQSLEVAIEGAPPLKHTIVSYRGIRLSIKRIESIIKRLDNKKIVVLNNRNPSSFSNSKQVAIEFAKDIGYRRNYGEVGIVLEVVIPKGIKVLPLHLAFGVGLEHVVSKNTKIHIKSYKRYREMYVLRGELVSL